MVRAWKRKRGYTKILSSDYYLNHDALIIAAEKSAEEAQEALARQSKILTQLRRELDERYKQRKSTGG